MPKYNYKLVQKACEEIWNTRIRKCCICKKPLPGEPYKFCFAHLLAKGQYPHCADDPNNIALVCDINCHKEVDIICAKKHDEISLYLDGGLYPEHLFEKR